jgi:DNA (cytosine-5)-methyltransferase 1
MSERRRDSAARICQLPMTKPLTFGSLFAGIGGFDLGFERAGMDCRWQVERDDYASRVLAKHWPDVTRWRDVETFPPTGQDWSVDVICAGPPCQPISLAGKRKGSLDGRWMWGECLRVVATLQPSVFVAENPASLLSDDGGRTFGGIAAALQAAGYGVQWETIAASDFGAPHRRSRVFVVARKDPGLGEVRSLRGLHLHDTHEPRSRVRMPADRGVGAEPVRAESHLADANGEGSQGTVLEHPGEGLPRPRCGAWRDEDEEVPNAAKRWWSAEPDVGRMAHGISSRVDRLRCLGNAVVPQVAEWIGRRVIEAASCSVS